MMKTTIILRKTIAIALITLLFQVAAAQKTDEMPVTCSNPVALKLYQKAVNEMEKYHFNKSAELFKKAVEADPGLFMAYYNLSLSAMALNNDKDFKEFATKGIALNNRINEGEKIYSDILERLINDPKSDVTGLAAKIVALYPNDYKSYATQGYFNFYGKKFDIALESFQKALEIAEYEAPYYNMIGYCYMSMNKMKDAREAFDKYIELDPKEANPYDSMGDYYMAIKEYVKASDSYMKAFHIDPSFTFSEEKAKKAQELQKQK